MSCDRLPNDDGHVRRLVGSLSLFLLAGCSSGCSGTSAVPHDATPAPAATLQVPDSALTFLVFGDWGRRGDVGQRQVAAQMGLQAEKARIAFVIAAGDNFYDTGVESVADPHWSASFERVYSQAALQVPWYPVLGNHDYLGNPDAEVAYSARSQRWRMPARFYAVTRAIDDSITAEFFMIDTSPFIREYREGWRTYHWQGSDTVAQRRWLDSALTSSRAQWKFIVGHHHVYSGGRRPTQREMATLLDDRMRRLGVTAYISGHEHDLQHIVRSGVSPHYFVSGAGSRIRPTGRTEGTRFAASRLGFMLMSITAHSFVVHVVDHTGAVLYRTVIARM